MEEKERDDLEVEERAKGGSLDLLACGCLGKTDEESRD